MTTHQFVPVYWPYDFLEADAIRQHLQSLGIACHLDGEHHSSVIGAGFYGNAGRWRMRLLVRQLRQLRMRKLRFEPRPLAIALDFAQVDDRLDRLALAKEQPPRPLRRRTKPHEHRANRRQLML